MAIEEALAAVRKYGDLPVPLHLRNAPTSLMKKMDYGKDYLYAHHYTGNFIMQQNLPNELEGTAYYKPGQNARKMRFAGS